MRRSSFLSKRQGHQLLWRRSRSTTMVIGQTRTAIWRDEHMMKPSSLLFIQQQHHRSWSSVATSSSSSSPEFFETPDGSIDRETLDSVACQKPRPLRLMDMYDYGRGSGAQRLLNAQFLYNELPVRIAQRAVDLLTLPHGLSDAEPIRDVANVYLHYLTRLRKIPMPINEEEEEAFTDLLQTFVLDRSSIPKRISEGVQIWARENENNREMEKALYRFFTARVGLRFLVEHFILSSSRPSCQSIRTVISMFPDDYTGCIDAKCNVLYEISRVADVVRKQTIDYYGKSPEIEIVHCSGRHSKSDFTHIPHHLHYMFAELLQNSCRAVIQHAPEELPPIQVIVSKGEEDVTVKIADKAGGIPRSQMDTIFRFAEYSKKDSNFATEVTPRGFGLPLARIYARYFGGELTLKSTEGYGLDAYIHMPCLGTSPENIPLRVRESPGATDSIPRPPRPQAVGTKK